MKRIMIVDDDPMICKICQDLLTEAGYETVSQLSGIRCMSYLRDVRNSKVDLIILDIEMPYMDGFKTLTTIRQSYAFRDIPVMFLTSSCTEETVSKAASLGINDYLKKPFGNSDLVRRVQKLIGGSTYVPEKDEILGEKPPEPEEQGKIELREMLKTDDMFENAENTEQAEQNEKSEQSEQGE